MLVSCSNFLQDKYTPPCTVRVWCVTRSRKEMRLTRGDGGWREAAGSLAGAPMECPGSGNYLKYIWFYLENSAVFNVVLTSCTMLGCCSTASAHAPSIFWRSASGLHRKSSRLFQKAPPSLILLMLWFWNRKKSFNYRTQKSLLRVSDLVVLH